MLEHQQKTPATAEQYPQPPTPETGQRQLLGQPNLCGPPATAERHGAQGSPPGCSPMDNPDRSLSYNLPSNNSAPTSAADTPRSPVEVEKHDIRKVLGQLTVSISGAAKLLGVSEDQVREFAARPDFPMLDHAVSILGLINWIEHHPVTSRRECD